MEAAAEPRPTPSSKKLIVAVIDGLTPSMLEAAAERGSAPTLTRLLERGHYQRAVSVFPSLTPVCLSSLATGAWPAVHEIPHLVWYRRQERRVVEYGSSFGAVRAAGIGQTLRDTLVNMNSEHLGKRAVTVFEALEDAGLVTATVNFTAYRGRVEHRPLVPLLGRARGPRRFFFYNVFESDDTGALADAAGGLDGLLDRYALVVLADHGQSRVSSVTQLETRFASLDGVLPLASNRAGQVYLLEGGMLEAAELAARLDGDAEIEVTLRREDGEGVARREGEELRFSPAPDGWSLVGDASILDHPDALRRAWGALTNPNAGELLVSPAAGVEFCDLGGGHHLGGGSHGSLVAADSYVPAITVGVDAPVGSIVDVAPLVLSHFGLAAPDAAGPLGRAA